jgi:hypothetical protein
MKMSGWFLGVLLGTTFAVGLHAQSPEKPLSRQIDHIMMSSDEPEQEESSGSTAGAAEWQRRNASQPPDPRLGEIATLVGNWRGSASSGPASLREATCREVNGNNATSASSDSLRELAAGAGSMSGVT